MSKVSTIAIVDEQPAEVFRQLYLRERPMRFKAAPDADEQLSLIEKSASLTTDTSEALVDQSGTNQGANRAQTSPSELSEVSQLNAEDDEDESLSLDFAPYDPASLDERQTDDWLQTMSQPDALDKSLRRIDEQARLAIDEQGVNTLFLALGMLHYKESQDSELVFKAPLILLPVELIRKSARSGYQIRATDEDPILNPALIEYLKAHGITLPELPDSNAIAEDYDLQSLLSETSRLIAGKQGWAVKTDIYLGLFSFQKFVMYKDLEANGAEFGLHRLIRQLVLRFHSGGQVAGLPNEIRSMVLDDQFPPESTFQVVDADSSQLQAIATCARNHDVVIEGPPGTGKSQTITNLIAQALAADKSVLFVGRPVPSRVVQ